MKKLILAAAFAVLGVSAVNAQAGKPGAIIINKVTRKANVSVTNPSIVTEIYPSDTGVVDVGYTVVRGFNLADEFLKINNRLPTSSDAIVLDIPSNYALVGSTSSLAGLTIDERCNAAKSITVNNNGLILGLGGTGTGVKAVDYLPAIPGTAGSTGIKNTSTISVSIFNTGTIAGGGGGGSAGPFFYTGGGGAPYGAGGALLNSAQSTKGTDATLTLAGKGGYYDPTWHGGDGGNWGEAGTTVSGLTGDRVATAAGYIKEGNVTITNIGSGVTKGR